MFRSQDNSSPNRSEASDKSLFAWALYDWANSAFPTVIQTFVFSAYFMRQVASGDIAGSSLWGLTVGIASFTVAVLAPIFGAIADQKGRRKPWLGAFTALCVVMTALLWFVPPHSSGVIPAMICVWLAIVGAGLAMVFYNAMLAGLAGPRRIGRWSGWGWGLGYAGGLACLIVAWVAFVREDAWLGISPDYAHHIRATFLLVAGWYALFSVPLFLWTPDEPSKGKPIATAVRDGLRQLGHTLRNLRDYRTIMHFLIARIFYMDGLITVFNFGGVYAAGTFGMNAPQIILFGITLNITAGLGAFLFAWIDDWIGSRQTILFSLLGIILPGIGMLLTTSTAVFWVLGATLGIFVGPVQAASRSYMARIAPADMRNEMFGLFSLSSKATAFAGPLAVGAVIYLTGSQRIGMSVVFLLLAIGGGLVWTLPRASQLKRT